MGDKMNISIMARVVLLFGCLNLMGQPTANLVAYYPFNNNANDESGFGRNGMVFNASLTSDRFQNANSAYDFDGYQSYISADTQSFQLPITVSLWFISTEINSVWRTLVEWQNMSTPGFQIYALGNGKIGARLGAWQNWLDPMLDEDLKSKAFVDGTALWHFVAISKDSIGDFRLYIDGILDTSRMDTSSIGDNHVLLIGQEHTGYATYCFKGKIDDIRIYQKVLSTDEIDALYNEGRTTVAKGRQISKKGSQSIRKAINV
jgi:hypothetical protein